MEFDDWIEIILPIFIISNNSHELLTWNLHYTCLWYFKEILLRWIHTIRYPIFIYYILLDYLEFLLSWRRNRGTLGNFGRLWGRERVFFFKFWFIQLHKKIACFGCWLFLACSWFWTFSLFINLFWFALFKIESIKALKRLQTLTSNIDLGLSSCNQMKITL